MNEFQLSNRLSKSTVAKSADGSKCVKVPVDNETVFRDGVNVPRCTKDGCANRMSNVVSILPQHINSSIKKHFVIWVNIKVAHSSHEASND
jgi:hypothetical protein